MPLSRFNCRERAKAARHRNLKCTVFKSLLTTYSHKFKFLKRITCFTFDYHLPLTGDTINIPIVTSLFVSLSEDLHSPKISNPRTPMETLKCCISIHILVHTYADRDIHKCIHNIMGCTIVVHSENFAWSESSLVRSSLSHIQ